MNTTFFEKTSELLSYIPTDTERAYISLENRKVYKYISGAWQIVGEYWG